MRYAKNTSWLIGEKILRIFTGLFVGIWIARYLGPEQFGLLSYAQSFVFLFMAFATLGLDRIVIRELIKDESKRDVLLGTSFVLKLLGSLMILPLLWMATYFTDKNNETGNLVLILASATIFQSFNVIDFYYQSVVMSKYVAWANTITLFTSSLIKILLILGEAPLVAFAWMGLFDSLVLAIGLVYFYLVKTKHKLLGWKFSWWSAKQLLKDSYPLIISSVMISLYMKLDQVMIKHMLGNNAVGQYAAAVKISEAWYFIPFALCGSIYPAIQHAKSVDEKLYYDRLSKLYALVVWMGLGMALAMSILGEFVINLLYGAGYGDSSIVLMVHIWCGIFVSLGTASSIWINIEGLSKISMYRTVLGMVVNILLNLILIPRLGIIGASIATLVAQITAAYIYDIFDKKTRFIFYQKTTAFIAVPLEIFWRKTNVKNQ